MYNLFQLLRNIMQYFSPAADAEHMHVYENEENWEKYYSR